MQFVFVINPTAGPQNAADRLVPAIRAAAASLGVQPVIHTTTHAGHARELAARYAASGEPVHLYACGGDGTLNEVLQAAAGHPQLSVGCVPCGSGNDYVRNFGTAAEFLDLTAQFQARPVTLDALDTTFGYGIGICAAGLDALVAYQIPQFRRLPGCGGTMAYTLSILKAMTSRFGHRLRVTLDGQAHTGTYMMAAICNGRMYGGGYCAAPFARMDDGWLDVVLVEPISRLRVAGLLARYKAGRHMTPRGTVQPDLQQWMQVYRVRDAAIEVLDGRPVAATVDGECRLVRELSARVAPKMLSMLLPPAVCARPATVFAQGASETSGSAPQ